MIHVLIEGLKFAMKELFTEMNIMGPILLKWVIKALDSKVKIKTLKFLRDIIWPA